MFLMNFCNPKAGLAGPPAPCVEEESLEFSTVAAQISTILCVLKTPVHLWATINGLVMGTF